MAAMHRPETTHTTAASPREADPSGYNEAFAVGRGGRANVMMPAKNIAPAATSVTTSFTSQAGEVDSPQANQSKFAWRNVQRGKMTTRTAPNTALVATISANDRTHAWVRTRSR